MNASFENVAKCMQDSSMLKASQTLADLPKHVINLDVALLAHLDHFHACAPFLLKALLLGE